MFVFPTEGGEPQLTVAGGWKRAWVLFCIFLETSAQPQMCVWSLARNPLASPFQPRCVAHLHSHGGPPIPVSEWAIGGGQWQG